MCRAGYKTLLTHSPHYTVVNVINVLMVGLSKGVGFVRYDTRLEAEQAIKHLNGTIPAGVVEPVTVKFANSPTSLASGPAAPGTKNNGLNIPAPVASPSYIAAAAAAAAASRRMLGQLHNPATGKIR